MSGYEGGGPAPYGGSASAPIGAPTPGPGADWEAVVDADEDAEKDDPSEHGSQALNATDNPEYAENVKENREAAQHRDYSRSSDEGENEAEQDADTAERDD